MKKKRLLIVIESVLYAIVTLICIVFMEQLVRLYIYKGNATYYNPNLGVIINTGGGWNGGQGWLTFIIMLSIAFVLTTILFIMLLRFTIQKYRKTEPPASK